MTELPLRELGWLGGFIFGILWLLRLQIQQNKVNGHSQGCDKFRREIIEHMARMEERVKHLAEADEKLNDELMELRGQVVMELQGHPWKDQEH